MLLVDEIDSLIGDTLLSVLRQLRAGYEQRPEGTKERRGGRGEAVGGESRQDGRKVVVRVL